MKLLLKNNLTLKEIELIPFLNKDTSLYYQLEVDFTGVDEGEYTYTYFNDENKNMGTGLLRVGELVQSPNTSTYNKKNTYITYGKK